jgi:hypothetical protein
MIKSRTMRLVEHVEFMGVTSNASRVLVGKPEGRPRHRPEDNIKMDLGEIVWSGVDWIHLIYDRDPWRALVNR